MQPKLDVTGSFVTNGRFFWWFLGDFFCRFQRFKRHIMSRAHHPPPPTVTYTNHPRLPRGPLDPRQPAPKNRSKALTPHGNYTTVDHFWTISPAFCKLYTAPHAPCDLLYLPSGHAHSDAYWCLQSRCSARFTLHVHRSGLRPEFPINPSQRQAVYALKHALENIQGPPGTGKSTTVFHIIASRIPLGSIVRRLGAS